MPDANYIYVVNNRDTTSLNLRANARIIWLLDYTYLIILLMRLE